MLSALYIYDPLCGWCYAATNGIAALRDAGVSVELVPSGLFSDTGRQMTTEFAAYARESDQRIAQMTGQAFSKRYRERVLGAVGSAFDSTLATVAMTAVATTEPDREADALRALQKARYMGGRDITSAETARAVLSESGLQAAASALERRAPELLAANSERVEKGHVACCRHRLNRRYGGPAVPSA